MDILRTIGSERSYTFHSHTQYCDGKASVTEMACAAVDEGFKYYGFSPHSPLPIESPCNMPAGSVDAYLAEVEAVRRDPALASCRFFAGMEVDYLGPEWGPSHDYFHSLPLDFTIGSVHFIPNQDGIYVDVDGHFDNFKMKMERYFHNDIDYVVRTFYRQSTEMILAGGFDILGHLDKVGQNASYFSPGIEDTPMYRSLVGDLIDLVIDRGLLIELNTKALAEHGRFFPGKRYLERLVRGGVPVIVNSDAHRTDTLQAGRAEGFALLDSIAGKL